MCQAQLQFLRYLSEQNKELCLSGGYILVVIIKVEEDETNTRGKKRKNVIDTVAASIILESYINTVL